jgi:(E)-4-hydroxy-3-methylbut-2-enyl-diphosphate synthase
VPVGGDAPITVQTMTNTITGDARATIEQIRQVEEAGADIVRVSCPDEDATKAMKAITKAAAIPVVADIHFHYKRAIEAAVNGAACLRINPGNIGSAQRVREVVQAAKDHGVSMRIGVNAGSLEKELLERYGEPCPEAMVESALNHAKILEDNDFREFKISVKASDVFLAVAAYHELASACDYPLHLGITEAGGLRSGTVKSSIGIGSLLWAGIGDTIRVSLSAEPVEEVTQLYSRRSKGRRTLREKANGDCVFFEQGRGCTIYSVRPPQCRTWPFWDSNVATPEDWERTERNCPGSGEGELIPVEEITRRLKVIKM